MLLIKRGFEVNLVQSLPKALRLLAAYSSASEASESKGQSYTPIYSAGSEK